MALATNAIVFVFNPDVGIENSLAPLGGASWGEGVRFERPLLRVFIELQIRLHPLPNVRRRFLWRGEHELHGAERDETCAGETVSFRKQSHFTNVAEQQICLPHGLGRCIERLRNRFLDQSFFESNAQIAGNDFDQELGFQRSALPQSTR